MLALCKPFPSLELGQDAALDLAFQEQLVLEVVQEDTLVELSADPAICVSGFEH